MTSFLAPLPPSTRPFRSSQFKLPYAYLITPRGLAEKAALMREYLELKFEEYEALRVEIKRLKTDLKLENRP
jgi:hypothetical protein